MPAGITLSDAIDEYLVHRKADGKALNTVKTNTRSLRLLLREVGNLQMNHLDVRHGEQFKHFLTGPGANRGKGYSGNSVNSHIDSVSGFIKWAHARRYLPRANNPLATVSRAHVEDVERTIVQPESFAKLLDAAHSIDPLTGEEVGCAHDRIVVALGLYLFLRQSEIKTLHIEHVDLDRGEIKVQVHKDPKKKRYVMGISARLDQELRRWLTWYANDTRDTFGAIQPEWFLVPARRAPKLVGQVGQRGGTPIRRASGNCIPMRWNAEPHRNVQRALVRFGIPIRDDDDNSLMEGVHTLRRSGARALFNRLCTQNYDGALRRVSAMLHHKSTSTTEGYLQITLDEKLVNDLIRGEDMFGEDEFDKVVQLRPTAEGN